MLLMWTYLVEAQVQKQFQQFVDNLFGLLGIIVGLENSTSPKDSDKESNPLKSDVPQWIPTVRMRPEFSTDMDTSSLRRFYKV